MSLAGNLKTISFPDILQLLSAGRKTGVLHVQCSNRIKEVAFRAGYPDATRLGHYFKRFCGTLPTAFRQAERGSSVNNQG